MTVLMVQVDFKWMDLAGLTIRTYGCSIDGSNLATKLTFHSYDFWWALSTHRDLSKMLPTYD